MTKTITQKEGALRFVSRGENLFFFNWKDGLMEIWLNKERIYIIELK